MASLLALFFIQIFIFTVTSFDVGANFEDSFFEINIDRNNPEKLYKEFEDFIVKYKRNYKDEIEKKFRFQQFVATHNRVGKMNKAAKKAGHDTKYGINKFSDLSKKEIHGMYSKFGPPKNNTNVPKFNLKNLRVKRQMEGLPKTFDLRNKKVGGHYIIGPIKTQDSCACCWGFAATAVAEAALTVHLKKAMNLSEQEVCDCAPKHGPGCNGGDPVDGLEYIKEMGLTGGKEYPFNVNRSTQLGRCESEKYDRELNPLELDYYAIDPFNAEYQMTHHLYLLNLPISVAFRTGASLSSYLSGILELADCDDEKGGHWHSGAIVGYGTTKNSAGRTVDYWIFRNSWWTDWGDDGYARIVRGEDWCSIESHGYGARIPE